MSHSGKSDLKKSIPIKLKALKKPDVQFIILIDQDSSNCNTLKSEIIEICDRVKGINYKVRVVCRELEAWYLGDLNAVDNAFGTKLVRHKKQKDFRVPDSIVEPKQKLLKYIKERGQIAIAEKMANAMTWTSIENNPSDSFRIFLQTIGLRC